jgi:hypothetical protein
LDHLHHLTDGAYDENKAQASAMKKLKDIAQKYSIKMVILMQPRKPDKKGVRLAMDEIKGTGSNSNVADVVLGLHRDALPPDEAANSCDNRSPKTEIHLLKGRALGHGKPYTELLFRGELCTFFEIDHREEAPPPATMFE